MLPNSGGRLPPREIAWGQGGLGPSGSILCLDRLLGLFSPSKALLFLCPYHTCMSYVTKKVCEGRKQDPNGMHNPCLRGKQTKIQTDFDIQTDAAEGFELDVQCTLTILPLDVTTRRLDSFSPIWKTASSHFLKGGVLWVQWTV